MATSNEQQQLELLEQIKRLLMLSLSQQGVEGRRIADVLGIGEATVSRALSPKKAKK
jgi:predicted transcriptional regulator